MQDQIPGDAGKTRLMPEGVDPDATRLAAPAQADPDATRLAPGAIPTARTRRLAGVPDPAVDPVPPASTDSQAQSAAAPDGLDVLGSPDYAPATLDDLAAAQSPVSISSPVKSLPERKRRLPAWAVALLVVALLGAAAGGAWWSYEEELWGGKTVPAVVGLTEAEATQALEGLGFQVTVQYQPADDNLGVVLSSDPSAGTRAEPSGGATIVVSAARTIPDVVGMSLDDATSALHDAGASDITVTYRNSEQPAGTVTAVSPEAGTSFTSSDAIQLTVAQAFTVPPVVGLSVSDAEALLTSEGLTSSVSYVDSDEPANTVVSADPGEGAEVAAGSVVRLSVSASYPEEPWDLMAYFGTEPAALSEYLSDEGFTLRFGEIYASGGHAHTAWASSSGDLLQVSDDPEHGSYSSSSTADVLADGSGVGGVRYAFSSATVPAGATSEDESGVRAVMSACGLTGLSETRTQDDVTLPDGVSEEDAEGVHFICGSGQQDGYTWAVIIGGRDDATKVVALVAPTSHFSGQDLSAYGGSVCDYVAVKDLF